MPAKVPPPGSAEFGLLPDAEGAQVAEHMRERGIARAIAITADTDWAERAAIAFRAQFEANGASIVGEAKLRDNEVNFKSGILQATGALGNAGDAGIFISMRPQQARLLLPQLKIASIAAPVFGTSHIYSIDANPGLDRDLDGVEFCDAPWLFGSVPGRPDRDLMSRQIASARRRRWRAPVRVRHGRLCAAAVSRLAADASGCITAIDGATGDLAADSFGRVHRIVGWARFDAGIARPVEGALSAVPETQ